MYESEGRKAGHWSFLREERYHDDFADCPEDAEVVSLRRSDRNWRRLAELPALEELTIVRGSQEQIAFAFTLGRLKRLRLCYCRKTDLAGLSGLGRLEELSIQACSNLGAFDEIGRLPRLRALHLARLWKQSDFSALAGATKVRWLELEGSLEKDICIESLEFLKDWKELEGLTMMAMRVISRFPALGPLKGLPSLRSLKIGYDAVSFDDYAWLAGALPDVESTPVGPFWMWNSDDLLNQPGATAMEYLCGPGGRTVIPERAATGGFAPYGWDMRGMGGRSKAAIQRLQDAIDRYDRIVTQYAPT